MGLTLAIAARLILQDAGESRLADNLLCGEPGARTTRTPGSAAGDSSNAPGLPDKRWFGFITDELIRRTTREQVVSC